MVRSSNFKWKEKEKSRRGSIRLTWIRNLTLYHLSYILCQSKNLFFSRWTISLVKNVFKDQPLQVDQQNGVEDSKRVNPHLDVSPAALGDFVILPEVLSGEERLWSVAEEAVEREEPAEVVDRDRLLGEGDVVSRINLEIIRASVLM